MKILKPGKTAEIKPAHIGKVAKCPKCGCEAEIQEGDKIVRISRAKVGAGPRFKCPTVKCDGELALKK